MFKNVVHVTLNNYYNFSLCHSPESFQSFIRLPVLIVCNTAKKKKKLLVGPTSNPIAK